MNDLLLVNVLEAASDVEGDFQTVGQIAGSLAVNQMPQILTAEEFHDHEGAVELVFAVVEDAQDVFMLQLRGDPGFCEEARLGFLVQAGGAGQDLDGDSLADHGVERPVDVRHAAAE